MVRAGLLTSDKTYISVFINRKSGLFWLENVSINTLIMV